ncbi:hypothetical protein [Streptomyces californicus]
MPRTPVVFLVLVRLFRILVPGLKEHGCRLLHLVVRDVVFVRFAVSVQLVQQAQAGQRTQEETHPRAGPAP